MIGITIDRTAIRATAGGDVIVRSLPIGMTVEYAVEAGSWGKVISVNRVAQAGYINLKSIKVTSVVPPPPPPPPDVPPVVPVGAVHVIVVSPTGTMSIDGLRYE